MSQAIDDEESSTARSSNVVQRILRWLRAGYPEGVPQQDYVALLGILRRSLTPSELTRVVDQLVADASSGEQIVTKQVVEQRITDVVKGAINTEDVVRVSARLAAVGWPLGSPVTDESIEPQTDETRTGLVARVVGWLRAGYPTGLPEQDYVALLALLRRRLTDDEVTEVARLLADQSALPANRVDIGTAIAKVTSELPSDEDVDRVRTFLSSHGWPLDFDI